MFKRTVVASIVLFAIATLLVVLMTAPSSASERQAYHDLEALANPKDPELADTPYSGSQKRTKGVKDIWYNETGQRLHFRISSTSSELSFRKNNEKAEIIEDMQGVICIMQEQLYYLLPDGKECIAGDAGQYSPRGASPAHAAQPLTINPEELTPMQQFRYITAEDATYNYQTGLFIADQVKIGRYSTQGHDIPPDTKNSTTLMTGEARAITFSLAGENLNFRAEHLRATFFSIKGGLM